MKGTWQKTSGGGPGAGVVLAVVVAAFLIGSGALAAIVRALEVAVIVLGCTIGLAVVAVIGVLVYRTRQDRPVTPIAGRVVSQLPPVQHPQLEGSHKPAVEPGREVHLHLNVSPDQLAAIMRRYVGEELRAPAAVLSWVLLNSGEKGGGGYGAPEHHPDHPAYTPALTSTKSQNERVPGVACAR